MLDRDGYRVEGTRRLVGDPVALAREVDAREVLVERDRDIRIGLVVPQADVEARLVLLNEVLLGEQRLRLGVDDERLYVIDEGDEVPAASGARVREMGGDALANRLCLAHVEHPAPRIAEEVHPRLVWQLTAPVGGKYRHDSRIGRAGHSRSCAAGSAAHR